jgi:hypothetical protein
MKNNHKWYLTIIDNVTHAIVGIISFLTVAVPAVLLFKCMKYVESLGVDGLTLMVLHTLESIMLLIDAAAVVRYIAVKAYRDFKE